MDIELYDYSPIVERDPIVWPNGARVAFYVGLNVEHFHVDSPSTSLWQATASLVPDPLNYGWRDYGPRVAIWRLIESLDRHGIRASVLLNSSTSLRPVAPEPSARIDRGRRHLARSSNDRGAWTRPRGWPGRPRRPRHAAAAGLSYVLDWTSDDQPYPLNVPGMISVPYSVELNDLGMFISKGMTGPEALQMIKDQFDQLYHDSADSGRVMALALHPFVIGQAFRLKYLDQALEYIARHDGVWLTTSDEIAAHYTG